MSAFSNTERKPLSECAVVNFNSDNKRRNRVEFESKHVEFNVLFGAEWFNFDDMKFVEILLRENYQGDEYKNEYSDIGHVRIFKMNCYNKIYNVESCLIFKELAEFKNAGYLFLRTFPVDLVVVFMPPVHRLFSDLLETKYTMSEIAGYISSICSEIQSIHDAGYVIGHSSETNFSIDLDGKATLLNSDVACEQGGRYKIRKGYYAPDDYDRDTHLAPPDYQPRSNDHNADNAHLMDVYIFVMTVCEHMLKFRNRENIVQKMTNEWDCFPQEINTRRELHGYTLIGAVQGRQSVYFCKLCGLMLTEHREQAVAFSCLNLPTILEGKYAPGEGVAERYNSCFDIVHGNRIFYMHKETRYSIMDADFVKTRILNSPNLHEFSPLFEVLSHALQENPSNRATCAELVELLRMFN